MHWQLVKIFKKFQMGVKIQNASLLYVYNYAIDES